MNILLKFGKETGRGCQTKFYPGAREAKTSSGRRPKQLKPGTYQYLVKVLVPVLSTYWHLVNVFRKDTNVRINQDGLPVPEIF